MRFQKEFMDSFQSFLDSGNYILGDQVKKFEQDYAIYCGVKYCIGVSNGLDAIKLILEAYKLLGKLKEGDEIIVPANTYIATILAVSNTGLVPTLVEPNIETFNINPIEILKVITPKTKAVLGVHLYGLLYDVEELEVFCKAHNLLLIEDAAQAHGATHKDGRKAGNLSNASAFSFYPTKNLGALGDGGAITTNDAELDKTIRRLRNYGRISAYENDIKGYNCRLDELQAAFLRIKLNHLDLDNDRRRNVAQFYFKNIDSKKIKLPNCNTLKEHVFHQFVIRSKERDILKEYLLEKGIETLIHYPIPIHKQNAYKELNCLSLPITEKINDEVLSLPVYPTLTMEELKKIVNAINNYC
ncbi:DegT/DnrJ/EryC1/StrS family aminotransferase [Aestuariivivens sp. NBU2969]|uniref:DegT/DnrJ/EryC1/StrS family aminotransferase n=1 Tax=Aestuariivivens sp. NBU2969 TaxID=2873267 RepID=UPI00351D2725